MVADQAGQHADLGTTHPHGKTGVRTLVLLGIWLGLIGGILEVGMRGVQKAILGSRLWLSPDVVWMAPLALVVLFTLVTLAMATLGRRVFMVGPSRLVGVLGFLLFLGPLLTTPRLHWSASIIFALGVAALAGRVAAARPDRVALLARQMIAPLAFAVVAGAAIVRGGDWLNELRREGELAPARDGLPNVLLVILDTVRASNLSLYGYREATTPHLERLAARGVIYEHAWSTSPWTLTSIASMFTGRYPHELSADWQTPLDDRDLTLAGHFGNLGYRTGGFVGNLIYATYETGLDRGFLHYEDYPLSLAMIANSSLLTRWIATRSMRLLGRDQFFVWKSARDVNDAFLAWLNRSRGDGRPFFAFLNYMDAHAPYLPPDSLAGKFGPERTRRALADLSDRRDWSETELRAEQAAYDGAIAYVDQEVGYLLSELATSGRLRNTLVIVAGDHGEQFGEHGLVDHGNSLYRQLLEVPLVISMPGSIPEGLRIDEPVSLRDLPATVMSVALSDTSGMFPGRPLAGTWEPADSSGYYSALLSEVSAGVRMPDWVPITRGDMGSLVHRGFHYILNGDGVEELYALADDPFELRDLADNSEFRAALADARAQFQSFAHPSNRDDRETPDQ